MVRPSTAGRGQGFRIGHTRQGLAGSDTGLRPGSNPWDEGGWHHLKHVQIRNVVCRDLEELHEQLHLAVGRLRQKPQLVRSFFAQAGLELGKS